MSELIPVANTDQAGSVGVRSIVPRMALEWSPYPGQSLR
jgi:hypothetical protein